MQNEIIKALVTGIIDIIASHLKTSGKNSALSASGLAERLSVHLKEVTSWASKVQFLGHMVGLGEDADTVELSFHTIPRRFTTNRSRDDVKDEDYIVNNRGHLLVLGDPGAGKTTTLKRLALRILTTESSSGSDTTQYPIVLRLRELDFDKPLFPNLADQIGIPYTHETHGSKVSYKLDDQDLHYALPKTLDPTGALIMLDGLDEVPLKYLNKLRKDINTLSLRLSHSRVIVTCRSGAYTSELDNFSTLEILPLDFNQIDAIAKKWLRDPSGSTYASSDYHTAT